jgi:hypothetical protein
MRVLPADENINGRWLSFKKWKNDDLIEKSSADCVP